MFYRRKIILGLLQAFEGQLPKINLQKLLLLVSKQQDRPQYDFVPYKFGCFSFSASADLNAMVKKGMLSETQTSFIKNDTTDYFSKLKEPDKQIIRYVKNEYGDMNADELMKLTYIKFPYWAIKSTRASAILTQGELDAVENEKPNRDDVVLFTIGYEGISLEEYLNRLIRNDVKILVDVRNNPLSMKFGFSKAQLLRYCNNLGIEYLHLPEVGIRSEYRQTLDSQKDYDMLFDSYRETTLEETLPTQKKILSLLEENQRIALTCFEADICQCHRKHLAERITNLPGWKYRLQHI